MQRLILALVIVAVCHGLPRRSWHRIPHRLRPVGSNLQIVGGEEVDIKDFPYQISMRNFDSHSCGGSIMSEKWILTAGHCCHGSYPQYVSFRVGSATHNEGGSVLDAATLNPHPSFDYGSLTHDVCVIELKGAIQLDGVTTRPVKLTPIGSTLQPGQFVTVSGWGTLHSGDFLIPDHLMAAVVPVIPQEVCLLSYLTRELSLDKTMFCAGVGGKDSCQGDSGGPVVDDQQRQVGVVSWGIGCAWQGFPGVYSSLADKGSQDFIRQTTGVYD